MSIHEWNANSQMCASSLSLPPSLSLSVYKDNKVVDMILHGGEENGIALGETDVQAIIQHLDSEFRGCISASDLIAFVDKFGQ